MTGNNGSTVNHDERVSTIRALLDTGCGGVEVADSLGMKVAGLRKWLRNHGHEDMLAAISRTPSSRRDRSKENAARAAAAAARIRTGSLSTVEVYTVWEAARLMRMGESAASVARQLGKAPATVERYASDVCALVGEIAEEERELLGLTADLCRWVQRVFAAEHETQLAFRREQRRQTALYSRSA